MPDGGSLVVLGLGPVGDMCTRIARHLGVPTVIGIDLVPERLERSRARGVTTIDLTAHGRELGDVVRGLTGGRGADAVIDAVGMEVALGAGRRGDGAGRSGCRREGAGGTSDQRRRLTAQ